MITRVHKNKKAKTIGRGGKRGKTSGRGGKGQTARAGNKRRPEMRDTIKKLPKRRGYGKNRARTVNSGVVKPLAVNLDRIQSLYKAGETVSGITLIEKGVFGKKGGMTPKVKILSVGELSIALTFSKVTISKTALAKIEKAGGKVQ
ncbi:MAG: uL15 family ribosomal protein [Candidatus Pacebacteria bacterium]|nr:uL15 family ribosomal protein [Candidatus Paceibacterota bacterium]